MAACGRSTVGRAPRCAAPGGGRRKRLCGPERPLLPLHSGRRPGSVAPIRFAPPSDRSTRFRVHPTHTDVGGGVPGRGLRSPKREGGRRGGTPRSEPHGTVKRSAEAGLAHPSPEGRDGPLRAPSGTQPSFLLRRESRGVSCLPPRQWSHLWRAGAPDGSPIQCNKPITVERTKWHSVKTKRVQLLAVDHSARASMKNAASCEN